MICLLPHCAYLSETSRMLEIHRALDRARPRGPRRHSRRPARASAGRGRHPVRRTRPGHVTQPERPPSSVSAVGLGDPRQSMYDDAEIRTYVAAEAEYFRAHGITVAVTGFTLTTLLSSRLTGVRVITEHAGSFVPPVFEHRLLPAPTPAGGSTVEARTGLAHPVPRQPDLATASRRTAAASTGWPQSLGVEGVPSLAALLLGDLSLVPEVPEVLGISAAELAAWTPRQGRYRAGSQLRAIGPLFAHLDLPLPAEVQKFLDRPGPTIYLAMTSTPPAQVRTAIAALSRTRRTDPGRRHHPRPRRSGHGPDHDRRRAAQSPGDATGRPRRHHRRPGQRPDRDGLRYAAPRHPAAHEAGPQRRPGRTPRRGPPTPAPHHTTRTACLEPPTKMLYNRRHLEAAERIQEALRRRPRPTPGRGSDRKYHLATGSRSPADQAWRLFSPGIRVSGAELLPSDPRRYAPCPGPTSRTSCTAAGCPVSAFRDPRATRSVSWFTRPGDA